MVKTSQFAIFNFAKRKIQQLNGKLLEPNNSKDMSNLIKEGGLHLIIIESLNTFQIGRIISKLDHFPELINQLNENIPIIHKNTEKTLFCFCLQFYKKLANKVIHIAGKDSTVLEAIIDSFGLGKTPTLISLINADNTEAVGNQSHNFLKELIWNVKTFVEVQTENNNYSNLKNLLTEICYWVDNCTDENDKTPLDYLFKNQPELLYLCIGNSKFVNSSGNKVLHSVFL